MGNKAYHRLDGEDRMVIQACLHDHRTLEQIAMRLKVSKSTVSRELNRNVIKEKKSGYECADIHRLIVCNTCCKKYYCQADKRYYDYRQAQQMSRSRNSIARSATKLHPSSLTLVDEIVSEGVRLGQSLHHIYISNPILAKTCSERTIRRLVYRGHLSIRPHHLHRYVRYNRTYEKSPDQLQLRDIRALIGRTYKEYLRYCQSHKRLTIVQYDSVIGKRDDKMAILTITMPAYRFQMGLLIKKANPTSVNHVLLHLFKAVGATIIPIAFPINLCDNGVEFSYFHRLETSAPIKTFYTNPYRATDKAGAERNHEFVRYCLPKGKSLDGLTQADVDMLFSHINSYVRSSLHDQTPYDLVKARFGKAFLDALNIVRIPNKKVKLTQIV
ncbi:MAG: IS30 family transposase [Bacilli bacterium]|jgi:IS30 family transposase